ncbi:cation-transporting P-type ATPase [Candidatus Pacearchaeota archaeon]|nr:cation-transporting P-type ATPase [Candidatus Pacearchaeota archaeon]
MRGLTEKEAREKLKLYGYNEIRDTSLSSPLKILFRQIKKNFIIYLLAVAALLSFFIGKSVTSYTILGIIILVVTIGFIQEYRAEKVIKSLKQMIVPVSIIIREGKEMEIVSREIVPGDIIILRSGERVPADCAILEQKELLVNESILTGESREVSKYVSKDEKNISDESMLFMGSFVISGKCTAKALHTGMNTKFGQIAGMIATAEKKLPLQDKVNSISRYMVAVAIVFSFLTGIFMLLSQPYSNELLLSAAILVIALSVSAFPEGFPVVLITALSYGAYKMAKKNAIVNRMSIIETLGESTVICSDKTGTITKGEMTASKIFYDCKKIEVSGTGYNGTGKFTNMGSDVVVEKDHVLSFLLKAGVICNDSTIQRTGEDNDYKTIGLPTEAALLVLASKARIFKEDLEFKRTEEILFNSERKMMSVRCELEGKNYICTKGAPEILLDKCKYVQRKEGIFTLTQKERKKILDINKEFASSALRAIALAYKKPVGKEKIDEKELIFLGLVGIEDPPREEVRQAIKECFYAGIKVKMITGDQSDTALAIAKEVGLVGKHIEGSQIEKMTEVELAAIVNDYSIFTRVKPEHKIKIVKALKFNGEVVAMTGDGVNDAPALKEAHIGIAMGKNGTDVSRSVADLTLKDDNFSTIVNAIREGRTIFKNIRKFVSYQLSCNYAELTILFIGVILAPFLGWQVPLLLALQILFMNIVTDDLPAITLSLTPAPKDIMREKPRKDQHILHKHLFLWMIISSSLMALFTLTAFFIAFNLLGQDTSTARTAALLTLILLEIMSAYNFLSYKAPVIFSTLFENKYLFIASIISLLATLAIIYTPLNVVFETVPLSPTYWMISVVFSILIIGFFNFFKGINNKMNLFDLDKERKN